MFNHFWKLFYILKYRIIYSFHYRVRKGQCLLETELIRNNQTRWLDLGSSINDSNLNFHFADLYSKDDAKVEMKSKYFQLDITTPLTSEKIVEIGTFDLIRMQHVFEHFTYEQADIVLQNCYKLLNKNGKLLISVPDLGIYINRYRNGSLDSISSFTPWAHNRIKINSPMSDYFSIFAHSMLHEKHLWCYDNKGLINKINSTGLFVSTKKLGTLNKYTGIPFTHNRIEEDLCILTTKNN